MARLVDKGLGKHVRGDVYVHVSALAALPSHLREQVHRAAIRDEVVCSAFLKVMGLLEPPALLFHPKILWRVLSKGK